VTRDRYIIYNLIHKSTSNTFVKLVVLKHLLPFIDRKIKISHLQIMHSFKIVVQMYFKIGTTKTRFILLTICFAAYACVSNHQHYDV